MALRSMFASMGSGESGKSASGQHEETLPHESSLARERIAEARRRSILESALDAILSMDADGRVIEFNPAAETMFGYGREEAIGALLSDLIIPPAYREMHRRGLERYLTTGESRVIGRRIEISALRANGQEFPVELAITRVALPGPPAFTAYIRDLTERKALERQREELLAAQVDARKALEVTATELRETNRRLEHAIAEANTSRDVAEAANQAKGEFLAMMSHELRTPLAAIIGYEELLADGITGPVTEEQQQQLRRIRMSADHLLFLIDQILTLSRLDIDQERVAVAPASTEEIVTKVRAMIQPLADSKGLRLTTLSPDHMVVMRTDVGKVHQILLNLLSNAVKYTDAGEIRLETHDDASHVIFMVSDSGIGIAPGHMDKIFDQFWQVERDATRRFGGTGLGLTITRRLAELLGGTVTVTSVEGSGSVFAVRLPKFTTVKNPR